MNWIDYLGTRQAVPVPAQPSAIGTWDAAARVIHLPPGYTSGPNRTGPQIIIRPALRRVDVPAGWTIGVDKPPPPLDPSNHLISLHNQFRATQGLAPLVQHPRLMQSAADFAADLARRGVLSHFGADGSTPWDRMTRAGYAWSQASENVAQGQTTDEEVMADWEASPGHRADILGPYRDVGVGRSGNSWVVDFGTPR